MGKASLISYLRKRDLARDKGEVDKPVAAIAARRFKHRGPRLFSKLSRLSSKRRRTGLSNGPLASLTAQSRLLSRNRKFVKRKHRTKREWRVWSAKDKGLIERAEARVAVKAAWVNPKAAMPDRCLYDECARLCEGAYGGISRHVIRLAGPYEMAIRRQATTPDDRKVWQGFKVLGYQERGVRYHSD